jgi:ABC-type dipeptide/oligopeptide/nickel transport system ATPase component
MDYSKYLKALDKTVDYDNIDPLQKENHNVFLIVGKKGSGKSTYVLNLLNKKELYRKHFNNIYLISPTASRDDKFDKLCDELKKEDKCYDECTAEILTNIESKVKEFNDEFLADEKNIKKKKKPHSLLILDDCISDLNKGSEIKNVINKMVMNSRHLKMSIWIISQKYKLISTAIRANADMLSFFNNKNEVERKALEEFSIDTDLLDQLEKPSDFMHVVLRGTPKYFINLKPVLSIKDTKANNKPLDVKHGGYVRGNEKNDNDSVLCLLQTGEIVLPRKVVDKQMVNFLVKEKGYNKNTGEFE